MWKMTCDLRHPMGLRHPVPEIVTQREARGDANVLYTSGFLTQRARKQKSKRTTERQRVGGKEKEQKKVRERKRSRLHALERGVRDRC